MRAGESGRFARPQCRPPAGLRGSTWPERGISKVLRKDAIYARLLQDAEPAAPGILGTYQISGTHRIGRMLYVGMGGRRLQQP